MIKNTSMAYGSVAKFFHWLMAILLIGMFIVAYIMTNLPKSDFRFALYNLHKATGLLLFGLVAFRLAWRWINVQPPLSPLLPRWQRFAAKMNILVLYVTMFLMPITGFLTSTLGGHTVSFYNLFVIQPLANNEVASDWFSEAHELVSYVLIAAFILHVLGAIYHHYFIKDDTLTRMWLRR